VEEKARLLREKRELQQQLKQLEALLAQCQKAGSDLEKENSFISSLLDNTNALMAVLDREGHIVRFNRACEEATGYSFAEVKNRPFWDVFLTPEEKDGVKLLFYRLLANGLPVLHDNYWVNKKGPPHLYSWSLKALGKDGQIQFVIKTGMDLTEREQLEKQIRHLASFPQLNPEPILEVDLAGKITFYNQATLTTLESLGAPGSVDAFLPPNLKEIIQESEETGKRYFQHEVSIGDAVFAEAIWLPVEIKVLRIYALNITERKRTEELLRQSEEKLGRAEEIAHLGHWDMDLTTNKLTWSKHVFRLFGRDPATFVPSFDAFVNLIHPEDREQLEVLLNHTSQEKTDFTFDYRVVLPDRPLRFFQARGEEIRDGAGKLIRIFGTVQDITERKLLEEKLLHAQKLEAVGRLAGGGGP
jgi:PAS domain S-box-containing protein